MLKNGSHGCMNMKNREKSQLSHLILNLIVNKVLQNK